VLVVDDEPAILLMVEADLRSQGYRVTTARNASDALTSIQLEPPDIAVVDIRLPGMDGLGLLRQLRMLTTAPVILISGLGSSDDRVRGLDLGADDYVTKPFEPREVTARVRAVLRRLGQARPQDSVIRSGDVEVQLSRRAVLKGGQLVRLTRTEWALLSYLASNAGLPIANSDILATVWGSQYQDELQFLRVWIFRLRSKLEPDPHRPEIIRTITGLGYVFQPDAEAPA
jgi:two-component system KDP operon response regulator KdpE